jgi:predicted RNA-binding Zn-ribbon protein involved in translation (DUF1610 family)
MVSSPVRIVAYIIAAVLIFLGLIFMIASNDLGIADFFIGSVFVIIAIVLVIVVRPKRTLEVKQTLTVTGPVKVVEVRCPNCGAIVDPTKTEVVDGKPYVTCDHCGDKFELTEEPTW